MIRKVLYLTYDGLSDPLGSAQIIPYLIRLQTLGFEFTIISFEKQSRFEKQEKRIRQDLDDANIQWFPRKFRNQIPLLSKLADLTEFKSAAIDIAKGGYFDFSLCRSYVSAQVGLYLKDKINLPFVFDTRGFWLDERIDKGIWNQMNPVHNLMIRYYRGVEKMIYSEAKHIIALTKKARDFIYENWKPPLGSVTVIPCATQSESFTIVDEKKKKKEKAKLGIPEESLCIGYLGSLGGWYDLNGMIAFFERILELYSNAHFVFLTPEPPHLVLSAADKRKIDRSHFHVKFVAREELNDALEVFDLSIFFVINCFSAMACSPTRLAELWAKGIPVISNDSTGDLKNIFIKETTGDLISSPIPEKFIFDKTFIEEYLSLDSYRLRSYSYSIFDLNKAVQKYADALTNV